MKHLKIDLENPIFYESHCIVCTYIIIKFENHAGFLRIGNVLKWIEFGKLVQSSFIRKRK